MTTDTQQPTTQGEPTTPPPPFVQVHHYTTRSASHAWRRARTIQHDGSKHLWSCAIRPDFWDQLGVGVVYIVVVRLAYKTYEYTVYTNDPPPTAQGGGEPS